MTRVEFEESFIKEYERLEAERTRLFKRVKYFEKADLYKTSGDFYEAQRQYDKICYRIESFRNLIYLPMIQRIQSASETEISQYKTDKSAELETIVSEKTAELKKAKKDLEKEKRNEEALIDEFSNSNNPNSFDVRIREQRQRIITASTKIEEIEKEIAEAKKQKEEMMAKSSDEVKQEMIQLDERIKNKVIPNEIDEQGNYIFGKTSDRLLSSIAHDPEKIRQVAELFLKLKNYGKNFHGERIEPIYSIPSSIEKKVRDRIWEYEEYSRGIIPKETVKFREIAEKYLSQIEDNYQKIVELIDLEKLKGLDNYEERIEFSESIDYDFLELHKDKLGNEDINGLRALESQLNRLSRKIFKTSEIKDDINSLKKEIKSKQRELYRKIEKWYSYQVRSHTTHVIRGDIFYLNFDKISYLRTYLSSLKGSYDKEKEKIEEFIGKLDAADAVIKRNSESYKLGVKSIQEQLKAIIGPEFTLDFYPSVDYWENVAIIDQADVRTDIARMVEESKTEAQKQADAQEALLKGITIEELYRLRKAAGEVSKQNDDSEITNDNSPSGPTM